MKVTARKNFEKQLKNCPTDVQKKAINVYKNFVTCKSLSEITSLEKLSGYKNNYLIRVGNHRIGFELIGSEIELQVILHRKEIYRFFP